ncbi:MAG: hypothetical protein HKN09_03490 [Saprospiraceae bacterium]|nr:hypothetical protein [Saprospiraceae bacterium]
MIKYLRVITIAVFFHIVMNLFMPWWNIFIAGLIAGYFSRLKVLPTFLCVFFSLSLYWAFLIFNINADNEGILARRLTEMLSMPGTESFMLINALIGGLCGGIASQLGLSIRKLVRKA